MEKSEKLGKPDRMFRGDKSLTKNKVRTLNGTREEETRAEERERDGDKKKRKRVRTYVRPSVRGSSRNFQAAIGNVENAKMH